MGLCCQMDALLLVGKGCPAGWMSCHHQMDQPLSMREAPSARMRLFCSHWGSWSVFWLRCYRLGGTLVAASPGLPQSVWEAGGSRGAGMGSCIVHPVKPSSPHGSPYSSAVPSVDHTLPDLLHPVLVSPSDHVAQFGESLIKLIF